jgi:hypothetical protein
LIASTDDFSGKNGSSGQSTHSAMFPSPVLPFFGVESEKVARQGPSNPEATATGCRHNFVRYYTQCDLLDCMWDCAGEELRYTSVFLHITNSDMLPQNYNKCDYGITSTDRAVLTLQMTELWRQLLSFLTLLDYDMRLTRTI